MPYVILSTPGCHLEAPDDIKDGTILEAPDDIKDEIAFELSLMQGGGCSEMAKMVFVMNYLERQRYVLVSSMAANNRMQYVFHAPPLPQTGSMQSDNPLAVLQNGVATLRDNRMTQEMRADVQRILTQAAFPSVFTDYEDLPSTALLPLLSSSHRSRDAGHLVDIAPKPLAIRMLHFLQLAYLRNPLVLHLKVGAFEFTKGEVQRLASPSAVFQRLLEVYLPQELANLVVEYHGAPVFSLVLHVRQYSPQPECLLLDIGGPRIAKNANNNDIDWEPATPGHFAGRGYDRSSHAAFHQMPLSCYEAWMSEMRQVIAQREARLGPPGAGDFHRFCKELYGSKCSRCGNGREECTGWRNFNAAVEFVRRADAELGMSQPSSTGISEPLRRLGFRPVCDRLHQLSPLTGTAAISATFSVLQRFEVPNNQGRSQWANPRGLTAYKTQLRVGSFVWTHDLVL